MCGCLMILIQNDADLQFLRGENMATITIDISDSQLQKLQDLARVHRVSPEALISANLESWLSLPSPEFMDAAKYVLKKNAELYQRLA